MKIQFSVTFLCMALVCLVSVMLLTQTVQIVAAGSGDGHCKELSKRQRGVPAGVAKCAINARETYKVDHKIALNYFD